MVVVQMPESVPEDLSFIQDGCKPLVVVGIPAFNKKRARSEEKRNGAHSTY